MNWPRNMQPYPDDDDLTDYDTPKDLRYVFQDGCTQYLGMCDLCHDFHDVFQLRVDPDGKHVYCDRCFSVV